MAWDRYLTLGFLPGLLAAVVMAVAMLLLRQLSGLPTLPELLADSVISLIPIVLFDFFLELLEGYAKPLLFLGLLGLQLLTGGLLAMAYAYFWLRPRLQWNSPQPPLLEPARLSREVLRGLLFAGGLWLFTGLLLLPLAGVGPFGASRGGTWPLAALSLLFIYGIYGVALGASQLWLLNLALPVVADQAPATEPARRALLSRWGLGLLSLLAGSVLLRLLWDLSKRATITQVRSPTKGLVPEVTPNEQFYVVSKNFSDPVVELRGWKLEVGGLVERPFTLTYEELKALPTMAEYVTLECISNPVGGDLMSNALWRGVPLRDLLARAEMKPGVVDIVFRCWDDYSDSIPIDKALDSATIVAYDMNGAPLPHNHGFPARLIVPGIYGMKHTKWVTAIEAVDHDYKGFWEQQGWSDSAVIKTDARIDAPQDSEVIAPQQALVGGVALAGDRGIAGVEISFDGGRTWQDAVVKEALSPYTWVLWTYPWDGPKPGGYTIKVRATDKKGQVQTAEVTRAMPDGATGYHSVRVRVIGG